MNDIHLIIGAQEKKMFQLKNMCSLTPAFFWGTVILFTGRISTERGDEDGEQG